MYGHPIDLVPDFKVLYWGPQVVWGFITILYLCHALLLNLNCARYCTCTVLEAECFRGIDKPSFWVPSRLQPLAQTLSPSRRPADFVAGILSGVAPRACFGSGKCRV